MDTARRGRNQNENFMERRGAKTIISQRNKNRIFPVVAITAGLLVAENLAPNFPGLSLDSHHY